MILCHDYGFLYHGRAVIVWAITLQEIIGMAVAVVGTVLMQVRIRKKIAL